MAEFDPNALPPVESPEAPQGHNEPSDESPALHAKKHRKRTVFYITAVSIAVVLLAVAVMQPLLSVLKYILSILSPLIIGGVIAYLCDPFLDFYEYRLFKRLPKGNLRKGLSLFLTVITAFGIVAVVFALMIPQLYESISELVSNYEVYLNGFLAWVQSIIDTVTKNLHVEIDISDMNKLMLFLEEMFGSLDDATAQILAEVKNLMAEGNVLEKTWAMLLELFNTFKNVFMGIFIAFYFLASKEKRAAQFRKFRKAMFSEKTDARIEEVLVLTDKTFGGFIYGKILDSIVIGILTFVLLTIFGISPYNVLIATFVGITNVIPVFGPFIGAIPSFFIVLISNPEKAFLFLVLILIIQQLDGNFIGPKILGDNTGVSSLCVIIAIAICSAMWGVLGMLIGVPIFAVVIELIKRMLEKRLAAKGEPTDTTEYYAKNAAVNAEMDVHYEHSSLLYVYEHSRFKTYFTRLRNWILSHMGRQAPADGAKAQKAKKTKRSSDTHKKS